MDAGATTKDGTMTIQIKCVQTVETALTGLYWVTYCPEWATSAVAKILLHGCITRAQEAFNNGDYDTLEDVMIDLTRNPSVEDCIKNSAGTILAQIH